MSHRTRKRSKIETLEPLVLLSAGVTDLEAFHQDGQTFLTWQEDTTVDGEEYHVYRHSERIDADNLAEAEQLTARWGPLDDDTSVHQLAGEGAPKNFVIRDLGTALSDDTGLFVYTTQDGETGNAYYAVTVVVDGVEQLLTSDGSLTGPVQEAAAETSPILVNSINDGRGLLFTHFMDYRDWNPTFQGYAYNYSVALPEDYDPAKAYPLKVKLHAYGGEYRFVPSTEYNWDVVQLFVDDPGESRGALHTWWYGFAADHNYETDGPVPTAGTIENFTQQRVLKAIDEVIANSNLNVDTSRIHAQGHSMGGSGALSLGVHYGNVFSAVYASEGMTDYAANPAFQSDFEQLWGQQQDNLTIVNDGPHSEPISRYGAGQSDATGVWDWLDHGEQITRRRGEDMAFLMFGHGKDDDIIDWETQGRPFIEQVDAAGVGYTAEQRGDWGHNWMGFSFAPHTLFTEGYGDLGRWIFRGDTSHLGISNASDSGPLNPGPQGTDRYNLSIDWATAWNDFHDDIVDTPERYEVSVRSSNGPQTADITPRNLQQFQYTAGDVIAWQNISTETGAVLQQGETAVDADGVLTIRGVQIETGTGSRLVLNSPDGIVVPPPALPDPPAPEPEPELPVEPPVVVDPPPPQPEPELPVEPPVVVDPPAPEPEPELPVEPPVVVDPPPPQPEPELPVEPPVVVDPPPPQPEPELPVEPPVVVDPPPPQPEPELPVEPPVVVDPPPPQPEPELPVEPPVVVDPPPPQPEPHQPDQNDDRCDVWWNCGNVDDWWENDSDDGDDEDDDERSDSSDGYRDDDDHDDDSRKWSVSTIEEVVQFNFLAYVMSFFRGF